MLFSKSINSKMEFEWGLGQSRSVSDGLRWPVADAPALTEAEPFKETSMRRCLWTFLVLLAAQASAWAAPRNMVLFVTDDQGLDAGCYGNRVIQTPHLDRLAAEGTRFTHAFCTTSSC